MHNYNLRPIPLKLVIFLKRMKRTKINKKVKKLLYKITEKCEECSKYKVRPPHIYLVFNNKNEFSAVK